MHPPHYRVSPVRIIRDRHMMELAFLHAMPAAERERMIGLARGCSGHISQLLGNVLFTPDRWRKCHLLYHAGFRHFLHNDEHFFLRPGLTPIRLYEAVRQSEEDAAHRLLLTPTLSA